MSERAPGDRAGLAAAVREALRRVPAPGTVHLAAWTSEDAAEDRVLLRARQPVPAASTIKVPILAAALREVAAGRIALDQRITVPAQRVGGSGVLQAIPGVQELTVADLLTLMIIVSDNAATNIVIDLLGMDAVNSFCEELGLTATVLRRVMMDLDARSRGRENTTSALDQANLLAALGWGDVLDDELRAYALRSLRQQQFNEGLPALLPDEAVIAHKTGELAGVRHDVGILTGPRGQQAVVAVLVCGPATPNAAREALHLIAAIGEATWRALGGFSYREGE